MAVKSVMTPFWLVVWSITLAAGWLVPYHYKPWLSFHSDVWIAATCSIACAAVFFRSGKTLRWPLIASYLVVLLCIPISQYIFRIIPMAGNVWISSLYLVGFLLAILTGLNWETNSPGQSADALFLGIGIAALLSVGIQLYEWLQLSGLDLWVMGSNIKRPHANLGQPNQLATLLLWGIAAIAWALVKKRIRNSIAILAVMYLLFGVALTESRTAYIGVVLLVAATWIWRKLWPNMRTPWIATGLFAYFFICIIGIKWLQGVQAQSSVSTGASVGNLIRTGSGTRLDAWRALADAVLQRPFLGFGWNQTSLAQIDVANRHPAIHGVFSYGHNLFLDMLLWCGIPLGLLICALAIHWCWKQFRAVRSSEDAVLLMFILVVANHSMLEQPLYFAYFLLPVGMVVGILDARLAMRMSLHMSRWVGFALWLAASLLLGIVIRDYALVESSYRILRMEWDGFKITEPTSPPDVILLTQWEEYMRYARFEPKHGLSADELNWMRNVVALFPNIVFFNKIALALALNGYSDEARVWLKRTCKVAPPDQCTATKREWARQSSIYPEVAAIPWPDEE